MPPGAAPQPNPQFAAQAPMPQPIQQPYTPPQLAQPYPQAYPQQYQMVPAGPPRNGMVFAGSIVAIVFGALDLIGSIIMFAAASVVNSANQFSNSYGGGDVASTGLVTFTAIVMLVSGIYLIVMGIMGIQNAAKPEKAPMLMNLGIGACVLALISVILSIVSGAGVFAIFTGIFAFAAPVIFVIGANQMKTMVR